VVLLVDDALADCAERFEPISTRVIFAGKVRPGKASTVNVARWPSRTVPTSASSIETSSFICERSSAMTNSVGVLNDAATVWPGSTCRASTTPETGDWMMERARWVWLWARLAWLATTLACATFSAAAARAASARPA